MSLKATGSGNYESPWIGCNFGTIYIGVLAYADDIVLLAPTASAMRMLLSLCDDYANEYHVVFNAKKSKCMYSPPHKYRTSVQGPNPIFQVGVTLFCVDWIELILVLVIAHLKRLV